MGGSGKCSIYDPHSFIERIIIYQRRIFCSWQSQISEPMPNRHILGQKPVYRESHWEHLWVDSYIQCSNNLLMVTAKYFSVSSLALLQLLSVDHIRTDKWNGSCHFLNGGKTKPIRTILKVARPHCWAIISYVVGGR